MAGTSFRPGRLVWLIAPVIVCLVLWFINTAAGSRQIVPQGACKNCNILVISIGPLRAKSLPCYGYPMDSAPTICGIGRRSLLFTNTYATASRTLDASFSVMTSLYPASHNMNIPFVSVLDPAIPTLPGVLRQHGYRTYFSGPLGDPHLPLNRGLGNSFDAAYNADTPDGWKASLEKILARQRSDNNPFFAYLHTYAVHEPYLPSEETFKKFFSGTVRVPISYESLCRFSYDKLRVIHPDRFPAVSPDGSYCDAMTTYEAAYSGTASDFDETYGIVNTAYWHAFDSLDARTKAIYVHALYLASIYEFDRQFQTFWEYAKQSGLLDHTVVVITGDHGDAFGEHEAFSHGDTLYTEVIHIPFILSIPHVRPQAVTKLMSSVDIMPTLLSLVGRHIPDRLSGINILSARTHRMIIAEHVTDGLVSLITSTYQLFILHAKGRVLYELYNLKNDPNEQRDVYETMTAMASKLQGTYTHLLPRILKYRLIQEPLPSWLNHEDQQRLIHTGYF